MRDIDSTDYTALELFQLIDSGYISEIESLIVTELWLAELAKLDDNDSVIEWYSGYNNNNNLFLYSAFLNTQRRFKDALVVW